MSLTKGELVVLEIDKKLLLKFDTKYKRDSYVAGLKIWEQELHEAAKDDYLKFSRAISKDLVTLFSMFRSLCHVSLRRCLKSELEYKMIAQQNKYDITILYKLIRKVCSGLISVVTDDIVSTVLEALHNYLLNCREDH